MVDSQTKPEPIDVRLYKTLVAHVGEQEARRLYIVYMADAKKAMKK